jgi:hypothetical protein
MKFISLNVQFDQVDTRFRLEVIIQSRRPNWQRPPRFSLRPRRADSRERSASCGLPPVNVRSFLVTARSYAWRHWAQRTSLGNASILRYSRQRRLRRHREKVPCRKPSLRAIRERLIGTVERLIDRECCFVQFVAQATSHAGKRHHFRVRISVKKDAKIVGNARLSQRSA